ncbi:MAG: fumarate reductase/succinate dehydrogenase flavoprotein subunit, partial [Streptosporangiales bacterium]|nr:fumarate reductase/succinate dehydrogenase flavoprotein subunit [Streptosporangiales bacterium]
RERAHSVSITGNRHYNPGWHLAIDLRNMLLVSECTTRAALDRKESRGGHTRDDYPMTDPEWGRINITLSTGSNDQVTVTHQPVPEMPDELKKLFE